MGSRDSTELFEAKLIDFGGVVRSRLFPRRRLRSVLSNGFGFDGSSVGFVDIEDSDMVAKPDKKSKRILPSQNGNILLFMCDLLHKGKPYEGSTRYLLKKELSLSKYKIQMGPEVEFYVLRDGKRIDDGSYMVSHPHDAFETFKRSLLLKLQRIGLDIEVSHHEVGPSQHEIIMKSGSPLEMADRVILYKYILRVLCRENGYDVTFMPKPFQRFAGNGMHVHLSLWERNNLFYNGNDGNGISQKGRYFIGGLLEFYPEIALATNSTVNSYKRLIPHHEAPVYVTWGFGNRSTLVRIPNYGLRSDSLRVEVRSPDSLSDPYLAFASIIKAGVEGIKKKIEPPEPCSTNVYKLSRSEIRDLRIKTLPKSLIQAVEYATNGRILKELLGKYFERFVHLKQKEWKDYLSNNGGRDRPFFIEEWELKKYFLM